MSVSRRTDDGSSYLGYAPYGAAIGAGLGRMFSDYKNPVESARPYFDQMAPTLESYMNPYITAGRSTIPGLSSEYGSLVSNPGAKLNTIGAGYQESPGLKFAIQQALTAASNAAARGGMAGSPQHQQQSMELATNLANQDYNRWLQEALGLYGKGLGGEEGMYRTGFEGSRGLGEDLASILAQRANLEYEGQKGENERSAGGLGGFLGGLGALATQFLPGLVGL